MIRLVEMRSVSILVIVHPTQFVQPEAIVGIVNVRQVILVIHTLVCVPQTRPSALETTTVVLTRSVSNLASASALRPSSPTPKMEESVRVLAKGSCVA